MAEDLQNYRLQLEQVSVYFSLDHFYSMLRRNGCVVYLFIQCSKQALTITQHIELVSVSNVNCSRYISRWMLP